MPTLLDNPLFFRGTARPVAQAVARASSLAIPGLGSSDSFVSTSVNFLNSTIGSGTWSGDVRAYRSSSLDYFVTSTTRYNSGLDGNVEGLLLENAGDGLFIENRDFSAATGAWGTFNASVSSTAVANPIPSGTAYLFDEGTAVSTQHTLNQNLADAAGDIPNDSAICLSFIIKPKTSVSGDVTTTEMPYVAVQIRDKSNSFATQYLKVDVNSYGPSRTASFGTTIIHNGNVEYLGGGYFLVWASFSANTGTTIPKGYLMGAELDGSGDPQATYTGTNRQFHVAAAHANFGTWPQWWFPVGATRATRTADTLTYPDTTVPANDFYVQIPFIQRDFSLIEGTPVERTLFESGNFSIILTDNDVIVDIGGTRATGAFTASPGSICNLAVGKDATRGVEIYLNGTQLGSNVALTGDITPGTTYVGSDSTGDNHSEVLIRSLTVDRWSA